MLKAMFDTLEADIVVMQETKIQRKDLQDDMVLVPGWDVYFSLPKYKKGPYFTSLSPLGLPSLTISLSQDILELPYTLGIPNAVPSVPRKASPEFYAHRTHQPSIEISQESSKLAVIPEKASFPPSWTK